MMTSRHPPPLIVVWTRLVGIAFCWLLLLGGVAWPASVSIGALYPDGDARQAVAVALEIVNGVHERLPILMGGGGGFDRLGGATLAAAFEDDGGDAARAAAGAERLLDRGAVALIGGSTDEAAAAISRVAERRGVPFFALNGSLTNKDGLFWFFRLGRTPALDARGLFRMLGTLAAANGKPLQTVELAAGEGGAGRDSLLTLRAAGEAAGLQVLDTPPSAGSPTPDLVLSLGAPAAAPPGAVSIVLATPGAPGPLAGGTFRVTSFTAEPVPSRPGVPAVSAAFQARTGQMLTAATAREITGVLLLADAINRAASTKPMDLRTALMATDTPGSETLMLWDGIRFDDSGQNVLATPALQQMQRGALQIVAPDAVATATAAWPNP